MLGIAIPSLDMLSSTWHEGLHIRDKQHGAGGGLGVLAWSGVCGGLGGLGMLEDAVIERAGGATVDSLLALSKWILSLLS